MIWLEPNLISALGEMSAGLWTPHNDLELVQVDVDRAVLKTLNMATSITRVTMSGEPRAIDAPDKDGIPALRTVGVSVVRTGNAKSLNDGFNRSGQINKLLEKKSAATGGSPCRRSVA